jgi:hypothetical protein
LERVNLEPTRPAGFKEQEREEQARSKKNKKKNRK